MCACACVPPSALGALVVIKVIDFLIVVSIERDEPCDPARRKWIDSLCAFSPFSESSSRWLLQQIIVIDMEKEEEEEVVRVHEKI